MNNYDEILQLLQNDPNATQFGNDLLDETIFDERYLPYVTSFSLQRFKDKKEFKEHLKYKVVLKIPKGTTFVFYALEYYCGKDTKAAITKDPSLVDRLRVIDKTKLKNFKIKHFVNTSTGVTFNRGDLSEF